MDTVFLWILGVILVPLIFGSYGFSMVLYGWQKTAIEELRKTLSTDIEQLRENELRHLEIRIKRLEDV